MLPAAMTAASVQCQGAAGKPCLKWWICRRWDELLGEKEALEAQVKDLNVRLANADSTIGELHGTQCHLERFARSP